MYCVKFNQITGAVYGLLRFAANLYISYGTHTCITKQLIVIVLVIWIYMYIFESIVFIVVGCCNYFVGCGFRDKITTIDQVYMYKC
jgi:hypothetical protein